MAEQQIFILDAVPCANDMCDRDAEKYQANANTGEILAFCGPCRQAYLMGQRDGRPHMHSVRKLAADSRKNGFLVAVIDADQTTANDTKVFWNNRRKQWVANPVYASLYVWKPRDDKELPACLHWMPLAEAIRMVEKRVNAERGIELDP